jgi:hypothetical protein
MRVAAILCSVTLALVAASGFAAASTRQTRMGTLAGTTKIETDCPVPSPLCKAWRPYPHARFTVTRLSAAGAVVAGTRRTVRSDANAHFHVSLRVGSYVVKPARGKITRNGGRRRVRLHVGTTQTITVRFRAPFHRH